MEKEIKINIPKGYKIDKENSTFECIKFKKIEKSLPKTWEEFCEEYSYKKEEAYIDSRGFVCMMTNNEGIKRDKNCFVVLPNERTASAIIALCQLVQLRDCYNNGWTPNLEEGNNKFVDDQFIIINKRGSIEKTMDMHGYNHILFFEKQEIRDKFFTNFRDLIEIAKPLL